MAIVKTARPLQIGDEILPWVNTDEEFDEWEKKVEEVKQELKGLPQGSRNITYLMKKEYKNNYSWNSKILYKKSINRFDFKTGAPDYKDYELKFNWGMKRTSNYEEIAFLEMHPQWFVREANRELTQTEKQAKKIEELEKENAELKVLTELGKVNQEIKQEVKEEIEEDIPEEIIFREPEIEKEILDTPVLKEEKVKKNGSTRKVKKRKKRTNKSSNTK